MAEKSVKCGRRYCIILYCMMALKVLRIECF